MQRKHSMGVFLAAVVGGLTSPATHAVPQFFNDNAYELILDFNITWTDAKAAAEQQSFMGVSGHLVTIFSQAENDFVLSLLAGIDNSVWIGASDDGSEGQWEWVTGEQFWQGAANGSAGPDEFYSNWGAGEPNDAGGEDYALILGQAVQSGSFSAGEWNDLANNPDQEGLFSVAGYVVEFDGARTIPEPGTLSLFVAALIGLLLARKATIVRACRKSF